MNPGYFSSYLKAWCLEGLEFFFLWAYLWNFNILFCVRIHWSGYQYYCMKSRFHLCFLWLVSLQLFGCMLPLNHVILFPVFFQSSTIIIPFPSFSYWGYSDCGKLYFSLVWCGSSCFPKCTLSRKHCQELTSVSSGFLCPELQSCSKIKNFWPEAVLPMKLLVPFVSIAEWSPHFAK